MAIISLIGLVSCGGGDDDAGVASPGDSRRTPPPTVVCDVAYYDAGIDGIYDAIDATLAYGRDEDANSFDIVVEPYREALNFYHDCADRMQDFDPDLFEWTRQCPVRFYDAVPTGEPSDAADVSDVIEQTTEGYGILVRCTVDAVDLQ